MVLIADQSPLAPISTRISNLPRPRSRASIIILYQSLARSLPGNLPYLTTYLARNLG